LTDVLIIGDGVIGLMTALAIARRGGTCRVVGRPVTGAASMASAGLLAPSIGNAEPAARAFMRNARDRYPAWIHWLAERTGVDVTLNRLGIVELAAADNETAEDARPLDRDTLHQLEPAIAAGEARLHPDDGYVDNVRLMSALREAVRCEWSIDHAEGRVARIAAGVDGCAVTTEDGRTQGAENIVLATGAWTALIVDTPRPLPIEPVRGQMLQLCGCPLSHAVSAPDAYLVPRGESVLVGSTLERVGFDSTTTPSALEHLRVAAGAVIPSLLQAEVQNAWAGLRPMTPDGLPILGRDPDVPSVIYACGHGKNGILLAPITAECIAAIVSREPPPADISSFDVQRFA
jgi:glycine/D-amino acid oxidase-like deaminating enzyme